MSVLMSDDAYEMGKKGAEPTESERLLFEAWMRGHCWALSSHWDGRQYVSDDELNGGFSAHAMATRRLWAAWRDRAALAEIVLNSAIAKEREAYAQIARDISDKYAFGYSGNEVDTADEIAAAIRARNAKYESKSTS